LLARLESERRARRIRHGLWAIGKLAPDPYLLPEHLTRPAPAYVSLTSALNFHGMIDQQPREITVASTGRARRIETSLGIFAIHRLPAELFGGWIETPQGRVATPEKAIFDLAYTGAAHRAKARRVPEIELPAGFDRGRLDEWCARIASPRLATLARAGVAAILARAVR
jgi:predicted transcriptional regulator of viral defense system